MRWPMLALLLRFPFRLAGRLAPIALWLGLGACQAESPPRGLEETCAKVCSVQAVRCNKRECARGCNLVIDWLAENEGASVIACVGAAKRACDDHTWAACATRIGPHVDGGPPAPAPPPSDDDRSFE